ncbi:hypothetical protein VE03_00742 [Pseudogymnoascus sp. 23342-1-I1]|nr:hypothetical protein VE03_00742 [Pseudogymnoascus sp. 23342-1-I1]
MNRHGANTENNGLLGSDWEELNEYPSQAGSHSPSLRSGDDANANEDEIDSGTRTPHTPRTPMKVRFDIPGRDSDSLAEAGYMNGGDTNDGRGGAIRDSDHLDEDDDRHDDEEGHDAPLLPSASTPIDAALENPEDRPTSSLQAAISNMSNSILGAGIIGQPYALKEAGLAAGVTLLVVLTVVVDWTIRLIVINSKMSGRNTFQGTVEFCFGWWGLLAISFAQWAFAFGGMVAFAVIVGDSIPPVIEAVWPGMKDIRVLGWLAGRSGSIVVFCGCISWPLSLYRDISKLAKASTLALFSMLVIIGTVVTQGFSVPAELRGTFDLPLWTINVGIFQAIGVISFAFVCHHNTLLIYSSLSTPTLTRFSLLTHISTIISLFACLAMALSGFLTFGSLTDGNVLNNFPSSALVNVARFCFGLNMLTTLPLEAFVCREVMVNFFAPSAAADAPATDAHDSPAHHTSTVVHVAMTTGLVWSATLIATQVCDLGAVFEIIGATSASILAYILPPLCYLKLSKKQDWRRPVAWAVVAFGCTVAAMTLLLSAVKLWTGEHAAVKKCRNV